MTKDNKLQKMILALGERIDQGFKEVNEKLDTVIDAVIELQCFAEQDGKVVTKLLKK